MKLLLFKGQFSPTIKAATTSTPPLDRLPLVLHSFRAISLLTGKLVFIPLFVKMKKLKLMEDNPLVRSHMLLVADASLISQP